MKSGYQSNFQLLGSHLTKLSISNSIASITSKMSYKIDLDSQTLNVKFNEVDKVFEGDVVLHILVKGKDEQKQNFRVNMSIQGTFSADAKLNSDISNEDGGTKVSEEEFEYMLEMNGTASLYGIARGILTSVSSLCIYGSSVILPMINVPRFIKSNKELKQKKAEQ